MYCGVLERAMYSCVLEGTVYELDVGKDSICVGCWEGQCISWVLEGTVYCGVLEGTVYELGVGGDRV